jgi:predicted glycoside hydrolase/deacetylase ChbG (UPF0249 family)
LIVVADDFGFSDDVNAAILEAFDRGLITHASIMANGAAFGEACRLFSERGLAGRIGVHLNLTEGDPLTEPIRACSRFCDERGHLRNWRRADRGFHLSRAERRAVAAELREQVLACRRHGIDITHLDSHKHVHNKRAIAQIVVSLARELRVPRVRLAHNCGSHVGLMNRAYKEWLVNRSIRRAGLAGTRWYGSLQDYWELRCAELPRAGDDSFELNAHPVFRNGVLVDLEDPERPLETPLTTIASTPA